MVILEGFPRSTGNLQCISPCHNYLTIISPSFHHYLSVAFACASAFESIAFTKGNTSSIKENPGFAKENLASPREN